jgi:phage gpG-like protein
MGLSGDLSKMAKLESNLRRLSEVPSQVAADAAEAIEELIEEEFDAGNDAYGRAWAPLAPATLAKGRTPPPLSDTEAMRDSLEVRPMPGAGISITIDEPAGIHQTGASRGNWRMPARPILPDRALPRSWTDAIAEAGERAITERLGDE